MISTPAQEATFTGEDGEVYEMQLDDIAIDCFSEVPAVIEQMSREQYWPNVWHINERGNCDLLSINCDTGNYSIVASWV